MKLNYDPEWHAQAASYAGLGVLIGLIAAAVAIAAVVLLMLRLVL